MGLVLSAQHSAHLLNEVRNSGTRQFEELFWILFLLKVLGPGSLSDAQISPGKEEKGKENHVGKPEMRGLRIQNLEVGEGAGDQWGEKKGEPCSACMQLSASHWSPGTAGRGLSLRGRSVRLWAQRNFPSFIVGARRARLLTPAPGRRTPGRLRGRGAGRLPTARPLFAPHP